MNALLFDIGGTKTRIAVTRDGRRFGAVRIVPTPERYQDGLSLLKAEGEGLARGKRFTRIVGGFAGPLGRDGERVKHAPNLRGWIGKPLRRDLIGLFRAPVHLENDSALAALGEATHGAGRNKEIVAFLTLSTGCGGARVVRGRIDPSAWGFEPGFQLIGEPGGKAEPIAYRISGAALRKRFGRKPETIRSAAVWREVAQTLAMALVNLTVVWSPDVLVLGGSVLRSVSLAAVRAEYRRHMEIFPTPPPIVRGMLGDTAGVWGALDFVKSGEKKRE